MAPVSLERPYERASNVEMAICFAAVFEALGKAGYTPPMLVVGKYCAKAARMLQRDHGLNWRADYTLEPHEWYVEWGGRKIGSTGI